MIDLEKRKKISILEKIAMVIVCSFLAYCVYTSYDFFIVDHKVKYNITNEMYEDGYIENKTNLQRWSVKAKVVSEDGANIKYLTVNQEQISRGYIIFDERNRNFFNVLCVAILTAILTIGGMIILLMIIAGAYSGFSELIERIENES